MANTPFEKRAFRDIQMNRDVGKKAVLGWFDVEFEMYGCAYVDPSTNEVRYRVSSRPSDVWVWADHASRDMVYPGNVETLLRKYPVPVGMSEYIADDVKRVLARSIRELYPKEFLASLPRIADMLRDGRTEQAMWDHAERIDGLFDEKLLNRFERIIHYYDSCLSLTRQGYKELLDWIAYQRRSMVDNYEARDKFLANMHGFAYIENGKVKHLSNARAEYVLERVARMEEANRFVGPVVRQTYWYNYSYTLADVKRDFKAELADVCDRSFLKQIAQLRGFVPKEKQDAFAEILAKTRTDYGEPAYRTLNRYGTRWGAIPFKE